MSELSFVVGMLSRTPAAGPARLCLNTSKTLDWSLQVDSSLFFVRAFSPFRLFRERGESCLFVAGTMRHQARLWF